MNTHKEILALIKTKRYSCFGKRDCSKVLSKTESSIDSEKDVGSRLMNILTFGDSLTAGSYGQFNTIPHPYSTKLQACFDQRIRDLIEQEQYMLPPMSMASAPVLTVVQRGLPGEYTEHMINRLSFLLENVNTNGIDKHSKAYYQAVCILGGTNDLGRVLPETALEVFENLREMYAMVLAHHPDAILVAITIPQSRCMEKEYIESRNIINAAIREYCSAAQLASNTAAVCLQGSADGSGGTGTNTIGNSCRVVCVDFEQAIPYRLMYNEIDEDRWSDALHMTPQGYDDLGQLVYTHLMPHILPHS